MENRPSELDAIFIEAVEITDGAARKAYLDRACGKNHELRARVERLLAAASRVGTFLEEPLFLNRDPDAPEDDAIEETVPDLVGQTIGAYKLLHKIGEGGMGVVYLAEQTLPVHRRVAIKVIRLGMDTNQVVARFEHERQALAIMDHPNIARVLDAGATADGRPYFAMELVNGIPITHYCDREHLTIKERIDLFIPVCEAIQHAHQKGIIHRDLKPSNVIVALYDGRPIPKVIDFGVAKATGQRLIERTMFTELGQIVGTMEYMAPEQAETNNLDVDTRADIYSLGVLLYELLTGSPPFTSQQLRAGGLGEMLRIIREVEPTKPSTKITSAKDLPNVAANRRLEPQRLVRAVSGELDWITMKCLEKDRARRYETANGLALDLQRFLSQEPVEACPPSMGYRFFKFVRRHRLPVTAGALILLTLSGGIIGTSIGLVNSRQQAQLARAAELRESKAREREKERADSEATERKRAETAEAESAAVIEFLRNDLLGQAGSLAQANSNFEPNPNLTVREAVDRAAAVVADEFNDQPDLEAAIRKTIGDSYLQLGLYEKAIEQLEKSAEIRKKRLGADGYSTFLAQQSLAQAYRGAKRFKESIELFEQLAASLTKSNGPDHLATLITQDSLACAYRDAGRLDDAQSLFEQVRDAKLKSFGPDHPRTLVTLHNLASLYLDMGKLTEAIESLGQVHAAKAKLLGPEHPDTLPSLQNLAVAYWKAKEFDQSIPLLEQLFKITKKVHGDTHPNTLAALANLGINYRDAGRMEEAIASLEEAYRACAGQAASKWIGRELSIAYERAGPFEKALALQKEFLADARKSFPANSPELASELAQIGVTQLKLEAWTDAEMVLRECLAIREKHIPEEWRTFNAKCLLGEALLGQKKYADAEAMLVQGRAGILERLKTAPGVLEVRLTETASKLEQLYEAWDKPDEAAKWRAIAENGN